MTATFKAMSTGVLILVLIGVSYYFSQASGAADPVPALRARSSTVPTSAGSTTAPGASPAAVPTVAPAVEDTPCELEAVPTLPSSLDPRVARASASTPYSQALDPQDALDREAAIRQATGASSDPSQVIRSSAARVPYSRALQIFGGDANPLVAPTRCVWLVTVDGPFEIDSHPPGVVTSPVDGYTIAIDAASGEVLDGSSGPGAPSLITGENLDN